MANLSDDLRADKWRAGCECARAGLCYRCQAATEIEALNGYLRDIHLALSRHEFHLAREIAALWESRP